MDTTQQPEALAELRERLRSFEADHTPDGWPAVRMRDITALLDDLDNARSDNQVLRLGYAAARLEIESLKAQLHAAKQINAAQFGLLAESISGSALRAAHGQASSQAGEYPALVCDYCGALTPDPWHSSGMLHGKMSKHIHSCDACAARGAAKAQDTRKPLTPERVKEIVRGAGYDQCGIPDTERAAFINGLRHGERAHDIKGGQHGAK